MPLLDRSGYTGVQITLHWVIAALVLFQLVFGESMSEAIEAAEEGNGLFPTDRPFAVAHCWIGLSILGLVALRIVVRMVSGAPPSRGSSTLMTKAAFATHMAFYALLVAVPTTGLLGFYLGDPGVTFTLWERPSSSP